MSVVKREVKETIVDGTSRTDTHITTWDGTLTGQQFRELVLDGLRRSETPGIGYEGLTLELSIGATCLASVMPEVRFSVTRDERWWDKPAQEPAGE